MKLPDGAPTHQSIGYDQSSSAWSLAYNLHTQNGLHDRTNCNDPTIGTYNQYHLSPNRIPSGIQGWYGLVYIIHMAGNPRIRPREWLSSLKVLY